MNPFAYFDCLSITDKLQRNVGHAESAELHLFAYLGCLLSLYRQRPVAEWGYDFAGTRRGGPFSTDIDDVKGSMVAAGLVREIHGHLTLSEDGKTELRALSSLSVNGDREAFLDGACSCVLALPIGLIRNAIFHEPQIANAAATATPRTLFEGIALDDLYESLTMLSEQIGVNAQDLMLPAAVWIAYLSELRDPSRSAIHLGAS